MVEPSASFFDRIRITGNPVANPGSVVICGRARFTMLTNRLIRLEWSPNHYFEDRSTFAFPNRYAKTPAFSYEVKGDEVEINSDGLCLHYSDDGDSFNSTNLSIEFDLNGQRLKWEPGKVNLGNLRGTRRTLDQSADAASLQEGLLSREGWSLFDDSGSPVWGLDQRWVEARPEDHVQDWYFFGYEHDYKTLLKDYMQFGEQIPLIPPYALGAWWSRYWAYHADDLVELVNEFKQHEIPLDVLVLDMDWHSPDGWTGYTWNRQLFPDPVSFLSWAHSQDLAVTLNLHPADGVQKHEEAYPKFAELVGRDPRGDEGIKFSSTDKTFVQHYFELLHHPLEDQGVDFWWLDWQQGEATDIKNLDPLPWLNHLHFQDLTRRGKRPLLYSRWGGLGNHRYPIGFSGDTYATWESLRFQPYFTATAANVGYGWWSHDIGGHFGATEPELYARWVQFGAVSPCLRLHSTKDPLAERRPWAFSPEIYEAAKAAIQFRYQLFPYLYSAARTASQQGLSLCYPMYYEYPDMDDAYLARGQYFFGDQLFVAPIVSPTDPHTGLAEIDVWIPEGTWLEYTTLEVFTGPRWIRVYGDMNRIPMYVRAGAVLPLAPPIMRTKEFDGTHLLFMIFPFSDGQFELYEDDGTTNAYEKSEYELTLIRSAVRDKAIAISIFGAEGFCTSLPATRTLEIHLRGLNRPDSVTVNKVDYTNWTHDAIARDLVIVIKDTDRRSPLEVMVSVAESVSDLSQPQTVPISIADLSRPMSLPQASTLLKEAQSIVSGREAKSQAALVNAAGPFVHCIDYNTFEDARQQLGTVIIVPPADDSRVDIEIVWELQKGSHTHSFPVWTQKDCNSEQIIHSPFADDNTAVSFRWRVSVEIFWQGQSQLYSYQSQVAYPSINEWQTLIYNREQQLYSLQDTLLSGRNRNPALPWQTVRHTPPTMLNLHQPMGLVLLEQERPRILNSEPLEAWVTTTLISPSSEVVILCLQSIGEHTAYLNGSQLYAAAPIPHAKQQPMFYSWMPPQVTYYELSLLPGPNQLAVKSHPDTSIHWWGIGATLFDRSGEVLTGITTIHDK